MADTLTSRQIIQKPDILIDPNFAVPPGIVDARQGGTNDRRANELEGRKGKPGEDSEGEIIDGIPGDDDGGEEGEGPRTPGVPRGTLSPPTGLHIVSQTPRYASDGTYVIDAVLGFDDVPGVTKYEVRISKATVGS